MLCNRDERGSNRDSLRGQRYDELKQFTRRTHLRCTYSFVRKAASRRFSRSPLSQRMIYMEYCRYVETPTKMQTTKKDQPLR